MTEHRNYLITHFRDLYSLLSESIDFIPDHELEFLVREMATMLEYTERHIEEGG